MNKKDPVHPIGTAWLVTDNINSHKGGIQSGSAPDMNPASRRAQYNKRLNVNSWQYFDGNDGGKWNDGDIEVTCGAMSVLIENGFHLSVMMIIVLLLK